MNGTLTTRPEGAELVRLEDGREAWVGPATPGEVDAVLALAGAPVVHYLCHTAGPRDEVATTTAPLFVARTPDDTVLGAGWLKADDDGMEAELAVFVAAGLQRSGLVGAVLQAGAAAARAAGYRRLRTQVHRELHDPIHDLQAAGFRVESCCAMGGITDVVLGLP